MIRCVLVALLVVVVAALVVVAPASAQDIPTCADSGGVLPCWCNATDTESNHVAGCSCGISSSSLPPANQCLGWDDTVIVDDIPNPTSTPPNTPAFVTATPRANQEQFDILPNGCPDWSQLGAGTVTPGPDDVSVDYVRSCGSCLSSGGSAGYVLPTPITGAINTPLPAPGAGDEYILASSLAPDYWPDEYFLTLEGGSLHSVHYPWDGLPELSGKDVVGALVSWDAVTGSACDVKMAGYSWTVNQSDLWLDVGNDYCLGPAVACAGFGGSDGAANVLYGDAQIDLVFGPTPCIGSYTLGVDLILREHVGGGIVPPAIGTSVFASPTPVPSSTPALTTYWLGEPVRFVKSWSSSSPMSQCVSSPDGSYRWRVDNTYKHLIWSYELQNIPGVLVGVVVQTGEIGSFMRNNGIGALTGCAASASFWPNTSDDLNLDNAFYCFSYDHGGNLGDGICNAVRVSEGLPSYGQAFRMQFSGYGPKSGGSSVSLPFFSKYQGYGSYDVTVRPIYYGQPVFPVPSPTPVVTPTATPGGVVLADCSVVEWRTAEEKRGEDLLSWEWSGWMSEAECYTVVPAIDETIPLDRIPLLGLSSIDIEWPGFELCVLWVDFPVVSFLGLDISLDWFLLPVVAGVIGLIIRS